MKALIIYDTVFGSTEKIVQTIAASLPASMRVETCRAGAVNPEHFKGLSLLMIGSPTRSFRPTRTIMTGLHQIPEQALRGTRVAVFDTRMDTHEKAPGFVKFLAGKFSYPGKFVAGELIIKGGTLIAPPKGFLVAGPQGNLKSGELERAAAWAKSLL